MLREIREAMASPVNSRSSARRWAKATWKMLISRVGGREGVKPLNGSRWPRAVIAFEPPAQSIQPRKQHPLRHIVLVQLVPDLPFQLLWQDDLAAELLCRMLFEIGP